MPRSGARPSGSRPLPTTASPEVGAARAEKGGRRLSLAWLGLAPFFLWATLFLVAPGIALLVGAFREEGGGFTSHFVAHLFDEPYRTGYFKSIEISLITAVVGGVVGVFIAYAALSPFAPRWLRTVLTAFSGVAANFGGIPLAFAFISTLGTVGLATRWLSDLGLNIYDHGFSLFSFTGLCVVYLYFQIPLMVLVIAPAIDGLRREWREAATNLGATPFQYWRRVGVPVLLPSILGGMLLLFGGSFAAYATAYALTSGRIEFTPLQIGELLGGNVLSDPHQGYALAFGMIVVIGIAMLGYFLLERRASRWRRSA